MTTSRLWTKDFIIVSAINFFLVLVFYLLVVVIGLYATQDLGATVSQAGLAVGLFVVGVLSGRLLIGQYLDHIGRKRCLMGGLLLATSTCLLYYLISSIQLLILVRFLHGIGVGIAATATGTVLAHLLPPARRGEGVGYFSASSSLATAIGPFIGLYMTQHADFSTILTLCVTLSIITLAVATTLNAPELPRQDNASLPRPSLKNVLEPSVIPVCIVVFITGVCFSAVLSYINAHASALQLVESASFFFMTYSFTVLISRPICGRLMDSQGPNIILYPCFVLMAIGFYMLGTAKSGLWIVLSGVVIGLGFGNIQSSTQAIVLKLVEPGKMALATSTFFIFVDGGLGIGPYLLGFLVPHTGYGGLYYLLAIVGLLAGVGYFLLHGRHEQRATPRAP